VFVAFETDTSWTNFDRSITVKHALQNTLNDSHQWLSHSFKLHQIRFCALLGSLQRSPGPLAGLRGLYF